MENTIKNILKNEYDLYCAEYGKEHILGTFVIGTANYGFAETIGEIECITIYLPSFEEVCTAEYKKPLTEYYLIDIRELYNYTKTGKNVAEILFSNYKIITEKYISVFESLEKDRETIGRCNQKQTLQRMYKHAKENNDFEVLRTYVAATKFAGGAPCDECYHITDPVYTAYLWSCKKGETTINRESILEKLEELVESFDSEPHPESAKLVKEGVVNIMGFMLHNNTSLDTFVEELTETEKKAFEIIKNSIIDGAVTIIISKIINETGISRPVWKSLLLKMENNKIAKITNRGVKGTLIEMEV